jgi:capsular polysaccharide biosynthesis protein
MRPSRLMTSVQDVREAEHRSPGHRTPAPDHHVEDAIPARASRRSPLGVIVLAVLVAAVCSATAYWVGGRGPNVYAADAQVVIDLPDSVDSSQAERILATEAATIKGAGVLEPVAESLGVQLEDIEKATDASVIPGSQIIRIRASSEDPDRAGAIATAVVDTYIGAPRSDSGSAARSFIEGELAKVSSEQADVQTRLDQLRRQPTPPDPATERTLVEQSSTLDARIGALQSELVRLQLQELESGKPRLISAPRVLADPVAPTPMRTAALGLIAGLALAAALVVIGLRGSADQPRP